MATKIAALEAKISPYDQEIIEQMQYDSQLSFRQIKLVGHTSSDAHSVEALQKRELERADLLGLVSDAINRHRIMEGEQEALPIPDAPQLENIRKHTSVLAVRLGHLSLKRTLEDINTTVELSLAVTDPDQERREAELDRIYASRGLDIKNFTEPQTE